MRGIPILYSFIVFNQELFYSWFIYSFSTQAKPIYSNTNALNKFIPFLLSYLMYNYRTLH